ncbi:MAG: hypothetical protein JXB18_14310 [Sedimentisphaerales bacterium]|nr:hypothetical protein [Sedimentisphaerales bacterium]
MKNFFVAVLYCLMIGSFLTACTTIPEHQRGAYTKMGKPRQAQEQVAPSQTQEQVAPKDVTSQPKK